MENFTTTVNEFVSMVQQFKFEEALDRFYDADVVSVENEGGETRGLAPLKEAVLRFLDDISDSDYFAEPLNMIVSDDISVVEWHYLFTHSKMGTMNYRQVSLQRWKNGRIVLEKHFYNMG